MRTIGREIVICTTSKLNRPKLITNILRLSLEFSWDSPKTSPARYVEITQNSPQRRSIGSGYSSSNDPQNKVNVIHNASNVSYPVNYVDTLRSNNSPSRTIGSAATSIIVKAKRREIAANSPQSININDASNCTTKSYSDVHQTSQNNTQQKINTNPIKHLVQTKPMSSADHFDDFTPKGTCPVRLLVIALSQCHKLMIFLNYLQEKPPLY